MLRLSYWYHFISRTVRLFEVILSNLFWSFEKLPQSNPMVCSIKPGPNESNSKLWMMKNLEVCKVCLSRGAFLPFGWDDTFFCLQTIFLPKRVHQPTSFREDSPWNAWLYIFLCLRQCQLTGDINWFMASFSFCCGKKARTSHTILDILASKHELFLLIQDAQTPCFASTSNHTTHFLQLVDCSNFECFPKKWPVPWKEINEVGSWLSCKLVVKRHSIQETRINCCRDPAQACWSFHQVLGKAQMPLVC